LHGGSPEVTLANLAIDWSWIENQKRLLLWKRGHEHITGWFCMKSWLTSVKFSASAK
jgi:hypothetical protein